MCRPRKRKKPRARGAAEGRVGTDGDQGTGEVLILLSARQGRGASGDRKTRVGKKNAA